MAKNKPGKLTSGFGQTLMLCLEENGVTFDALHDRTMISKVWLVGLKLGYWEPKASDVFDIAEALTISPEELSKPPPTKRGGSAGVSRSSERVLPKPDPCDTSIDEHAVLIVESLRVASASTIDPLSTPQPEPQEITMSDGIATPPETSILVWNKTSVTHNGTVYDLSDRNLLRLIANRIRFAKGFMSYAEVIQQAKLKGWQPNQLSNLSALKPRELEAIAAACDVTVISLLTGEGAPTLQAGESAEEWLTRYSHESPTGEVLAKTASDICAALTLLHPAAAHMVLGYLTEKLSD